MKRSINLILEVSRCTISIGSGICLCFFIGSGLPYLDSGQTHHPPRGRFPLRELPPTAPKRKRNRSLRQLGCKLWNEPQSAAGNETQSPHMDPADGAADWNQMDCFCFSRTFDTRDFIPCYVICHAEFICPTPYSPNPCCRLMKQFKTCPFHTVDWQRVGRLWRGKPWIAVSLFIIATWAEVFLFF